MRPNSPLEPDVLRPRFPWGSWPSSAGMDEVLIFFKTANLQVNAGSGCDPIRHSPCCMLHVACRMPADRTLCRKLLPSAGPAAVAKLCFDLCKDQSPHFSEVHCGQTRGQGTHPGTLCTYTNYLVRLEGSGLQGALGHSKPANPSRTQCTNPGLSQATPATQGLASLAEQ